jgi:4-hydroxy-3-methylbut-2-enyl diphosphate reductase
MCFGVRDALRATITTATREPVTILGQLVHNPVVDQQLNTLGVHNGALNDLHSAATKRVVITAHGASDDQRGKWLRKGHSITDTTCPLVHKAHAALKTLVSNGYHPVVIGQRDHVEVRGLTGDFPEANVLLSHPEIATLPAKPKLGIIAQTTQPIHLVAALVEAIEIARPNSDVRFIDTVCQPTKQRQAALEALCRISEVVIVIGGRNSNNTQQLTHAVRQSGVIAHQIETADDLDPGWFYGITDVGITAGTSTLDETVHAVMERLSSFNAALCA